MIYEAGEEIRCVGPARKPRFKGDRCGGFVTRLPIGYRGVVVGVVGHSSLADPADRVYACSVCAIWNVVRDEPVPDEIREAA